MSPSDLKENSYHGKASNDSPVLNVVHPLILLLGSTKEQERLLEQHVVDVYSHRERLGIEGHGHEQSLLETRILDRLLELDGACDLAHGLLTILSSGQVVVVTLTHAKIGITLDELVGEFLIIFQVEDGDL